MQKLCPYKPKNMKPTNASRSKAQISDKVQAFIDEEREKAESKKTQKRGRKK